MAKQQLTQRGIEQRKQAPLKHSGEKAVKAIKNREPFEGIAAEMEQEVRRELETVGRGEIVTQGAIRLEVAARLFWNAFREAARDNDIEKLDSYVKRFGWLQTSALRAWQQVKEDSTAPADVMDYEAMVSDG